MTALPRQGEVRDAKAEPDDERLYSVTTIIGILDKPALIPWAVGVTAEKVVAKLDVIGRHVADDGPDEAIEYVKRLRWQTGGRLSDADLGSVAHHLFNTYALTGARPDVEPEMHPLHAVDQSLLHPEDLSALYRMLDQFERFLHGYQPDYLATEIVVFHPDYGYAGQADAFVTIDGMRLIVDYKTSKKTFDRRGKVRAPYPEVGLQLAAYRYAAAAAIWRARRYESNRRRYYLLGPDERAAAVPVPEVDGGIAIRITPDHLGVYPVRCGERDHRAFLFALELARWSFNDAAGVVGNEMMPRAVVDQPEDDPFAGLPV